MADNFTDVLRAEHAAIYAYGALGAHLAGEQQRFAYTADAAHRSRRDALVLRLSANGATPPPAEPGYTLAPLTDAASALRLGIQVEERTADAWLGAVAPAGGDDRAFALDGLTDCALRAAQLRRFAGVVPAVTPFPGRR